MKHYKPKNPECIHNDSCIECDLLSECFPKTFKKRQKAVDKLWKEKYGDEF